MLFHGVTTITVSAISDFQKRDQFDVIKGLVGEVKMDWDGSSVLFCIPRLCSPKRSLRVRPACPMYCEGRVVSVFKHRLRLIR